MSKDKFFKCAIFSYFYGGGLFWFRIFNLGLSFKDILTYDFKGKTPNTYKGIFFNRWLITIIT